MKTPRQPWWTDCKKLCKEIIRVPSISGEEKELARFLKERMEKLEYDEVRLDEAGNVVAKLSGEGSLPTIGFTAHLDHVSPGNEKDWKYPPYSGKEAGGYIHGRGASDTKGAIATQVFIPKEIKRSGIRHGDIYVFFVVMEEKGGYGSKAFDKSPLDLVILGEPTENNLRIGHRGRLELEVSVTGKPAHASVPEKAKNPHYPMAEFLKKLKEINKATYEEHESSAAPTLYSTDQESSNVIPSKCELTIDWRNVPGEGEGRIKEKIRKILPEKGEVKVKKEELTSYRGEEFTEKRKRKPYRLSGENEYVLAIEEGLKDHLDRKIDVGWWDFGTDAGFFSKAGVPVVGFSPCEEKYAHTSEDRVSKELMRQALGCYPVIIDSVSKRI